MIRPQLLLDVCDELFVDNFAGGGGASTGIEMALGRHVDHAINHDRHALGMHRINHPQTIHHCEDVFDVDPATITERRRVGAGWFSPDCKHFSKAKGGKPLSKKIRGLAFVILRWAKIRTRVIYMENVEEITTWGPLLPNHKPDPKYKGRTWKAFVAALSTGLDPNHPDIPEMLEVLGDSVTKEELVRGFGYQVEWRELRACDYGAPTIRKRLFMIARCDGRPIVWPEPTHAAPEIARAKRLKPWRTVAECIDWSIPCNSIFLNNEEARRANCRRPLANSTLRRIAAGIDRYVLKAKRPFIVSLTHQGGERVESVDAPARTITGAHRGEKAVVDATVAPFVSDSVNNGSGREGNHSPEEPIRTICAEVKGGHFELVSAHLMQKGHLKSNSQMVKGADEPMRTQATRAEHCLVSAAVAAAHIESLYTDKGSGGPRASAAESPCPTITASARHALATASLVSGAIVGAGGPVYSGKPKPLDKPFNTLLTENHNHLASASLVKLRGDAETHAPGQPAGDPLHTVSAGGNHHGVVTGSLVAYYGNDEDGQAVTEPLRTVTTRERFGLAQCDVNPPAMTPAQIAGAHRVAKFLRQFGVQFEGEFATVGGLVIVDIGLRMLTARELFRAQGFPDTYCINRAWLINPKTGALQEEALTKEQQIRMCGNSVSPPVAEAIVAANSPDLKVWANDERKTAQKRLHVPA